MSAGPIRTAKRARDYVRNVLITMLDSELHCKDPGWFIDPDDDDITIRFVRAALREEIAAACKRAGVVQKART